MSNELLLPDITITAIPTGVITVTPPQVVKVSTIPAVQPVEVVGTVTVVLTNEPTIDIGKVDQGLPGILPWPVTGSLTIDKSLSAITTAVTVTTSPTALLGMNLNRVGLAIQNTTNIVFIKLDSTVTTGLYSYELPKKGILEIEGYCGPVTAVSPLGSVVVMVTEKL